MAQVICSSGEVADGGHGVRFHVRWRGQPAPAFVIRYRGRVYAYLNRCAHRQVELDWEPGRFYTIDGNSLICATHGARYAPDTGDCLGGPCGRAGLVALPIAEREGRVLLDEADELQLIPIPTRT